MFCDADDKVLKRILIIYRHCRHLPQRTAVHYHLRERSHNKTLISKTFNLSERDFPVRMLYTDCY